jgi:hypothetical protein
MASPYETPPGAGEHGEFYRGYVSRVGPGDILARLAAQATEIESLFGSMPPELLSLRYAPGKWTPKQILGHLCDTERVMTYRALCAARGDTTPLPGFDENAYADAAGFEQREIRSLLAEFGAVRAATISLFASLTTEQWIARGVANDSPTTPRALAWITVGHASHHMAVIRERYLPAAATESVGT